LILKQAKFFLFLLKQEGLEVYFRVS